MGWVPAGKALVSLTNHQASGNRPAPPALPPLSSGMVLVDPSDQTQIAPLVVMERFAPGLQQFLDGVPRSSKGEKVSPWPTQSFARAFDEVEPATGAVSVDNIQSYDAHFVLYGSIEKDGILSSKVPRLTKTGVYSYIHYKSPEEVAEEEETKVPAKTMEVFGAYLALDYDLPKHGVDGGWTPQRLEEISKILHEVGERNALFKYPTVVYRTKGGLRLVWALYNRVPIEGKRGLEDLLMGIVGDAYIAGLAVDPTCKDWTRLFRLPKVRRPKNDLEFDNTWESGYFSISYNRVDLFAQDTRPQQVLAYEPECFRGISEHKREDYEKSDLARDMLKVGRWAARVGKIPRGFTEMYTEVEVGEKPTNTDEHTHAGKLQSLKSKTVKARVQSLVKKTGAWDAADATLAYQALYENKPLFLKEHGKEWFHFGILRVVSFLVRHLHNVPSVDAQIIYCLVLSAAWRSNELRKGSDKRSKEKLEKEVWDAVEYIWRNDVARGLSQAEEVEEDKEILAIRRAAHTQSLEGIIKLVTNQIMEWLPDHDPNRIKEHVKNWFIIQMPDGARHVLRRKPDGTLAYGPGVKGLPGLACQVRDCGHDFIKITKNEIGDEKAAIWKTETDIMSEFGTTLFNKRLSRKVSTNMLKPVDGDVAAFVEAIPGFRTDIEPVEHEDVDQWLRLLGGTQSEKLLDWCAALPNLDQPIAALYLQKQTSAGKGMLGQAIVQMTKTRSYTPFEKAMGEFQDTMASSPFVWADEEIGASKFSGKSSMNTFKQLVTGEFCTLNSKGEKHVQIEGQWRILLTANNTDIFKINQDVNENDMEAMRLRLLRVTPSIKAVEYLESLGGREGTKDWPEKKIPEHIMWLARNRLVKPGKRLLVEGSQPKEDENENALGLNSVTGDIILRALGKMLQERFDPKTGDTTTAYRGAFKIYLEDNLFMVNSDSLHEWMRKLFSDDRSVKVPTVRSIGTALNIMSNSAAAIRATTSDPRRLTGTIRLHPLPLHKIIATLDVQGLNSDFRGNGVINDAYYQKWLPVLYTQLASSVSTQTVDIDSKQEPAINGNHSYNGHSSNNGIQNKPVNWAALRPVPKEN